MPDNKKDRASLGEQSGRSSSSSDDVLSRSGIDRTREDLKKLEKDVDDLTIRRGSDQGSDVRERNVEREGGKFESGRGDVRESSNTRDTSIRRADSPRKDTSDTSRGSQSGSKGGSQGGKVAGSGFTMEESKDAKSATPSREDRYSSRENVKRSGNLNEPERQRDRDIDRSRDIDKSKM
jgi:hypothetical protein